MSDRQTDPVHTLGDLRVETADFDDGTLLLIGTQLAMLSTMSRVWHIMYEECVTGCCCVRVTRDWVARDRIFLTHSACNAFAFMVAHNTRKYRKLSVVMCPAIILSGQ